MQLPITAIALLHTTTVVCDVNMYTVHECYCSTRVLMSRCRLHYSDKVYQLSKHDHYQVAMRVVSQQLKKNQIHKYPPQFRQ